MEYANKETTKAKWFKNKSSNNLASCCASTFSLLSII